MLMRVQMRGIATDQHPERVQLPRDLLTNGSGVVERDYVVDGTPSVVRVRPFSKINCKPTLSRGFRRA